MPNNDIAVSPVNTFKLSFTFSLGGDQLHHGEYFLKSDKCTFIVVSEQNDNEKCMVPTHFQK